MFNNYLCLLILFLAVSFIPAQNRLGITVSDPKGKPVAYAKVQLTNFEKNITEITDLEGTAKFTLQSGNYTLVVSHLSFKTYSRKIAVTDDKSISVVMIEQINTLQEVVITAREGRGITTSSVINKDAMKHLQPSSFSDLVSLIPGNTVRTPQLNAANFLTLREAGIKSGAYDTGALGTSFMIDGMTINSRADLQETVGNQIIITPGSGYVDEKRSSVRRGVDMRAISTDDIEKVEIIRGIPSVQYGDMSNGVVKISRKKGQSKWSARFKADGFSKLFSLTKGISLTKGRFLNVSAGFLDAKADPRNTLENYKRYNASLRFQQLLGANAPVDWDMSLDYTGTVDEEKKDPDAGYMVVDKYQSSYRNLRWGNAIKWNPKGVNLPSLELNTSVSSSHNKIKQSKWVQIKGASALPINTVEGEFYGFFVEPNYVSDLLIDGKPLDIDASLLSRYQWKGKGFKSNLLAGVQASYSKNNGQGQVYDLMRPPSPDMQVRPRSFKEIPAISSLSFFVENDFKKKWKGFVMNAVAGVRASGLMDLDDHYAMQGKYYMDPRANIKIDFPAVSFENQKQLKFNLTFGWGKNTKMPTQAMLYPQNIFSDFVQLNYYHNNKKYRQIHYQTYTFPQINYNLKPAVNLKKEIRLGTEYDFQNLYITYFTERMDSGFRNMSEYYARTYKKYDTSSLDYNTITAAPQVEDLPYSVQNVLILASRETNGSSIYKKGVEFQYSGKRLPLINTRFTFNGAWLRTEYSNSLPVYRFPRNATINGKTRYILGVYQDEDSYLRERFSSTFTGDTYIPSIGLTTSLAVDLSWYSMKKQMPQNGIPTHYIDSDGNRYVYGDKEKADPILSSLVISYNESLYYAYRTPFYANAHLKISKEFYKYFTVSMYVNKLFSYYSDYYVDGKKIERRGMVDPYFGMEMNINF